MQYRPFGLLGWLVSALGFGCMRFPTTDGRGGANIDAPLAERMLRTAIEAGVNYLDTAYVYHGGQSERFLGQVLRDQRLRQQVKIATKLPCWEVKSSADFDRLLAEQLHRLQTEHIDFYLLHALNRNSWREMLRWEVFTWAEKALAQGWIGHLGFSFHDDYATFQEIVDGYDRWTFCQIQYNYMDVDNQAGQRGLHYAAAKGLAVVIMEPLLGGRLVNPPAPIQALWDRAPRRRPAATWALQWLWNQPEVTTVLSGMSTLEQVQENLAAAEESGVNTLRPAEVELIEQVRQRYQELAAIPCTGCKYCLPCPQGVNIPRLFEVYNSGLIYDKADFARNDYRLWVPAGEKADLCLACGECETRCPQSIPISRWMPIIDRVLGEGQPYRRTPD